MIIASTLLLNEILDISVFCIISIEYWLYLSKASLFSMYVFEVNSNCKLMNSDFDHIEQTLCYLNFTNFLFSPEASTVLVSPIVV